jgi:hypothetical protein
MENDIFSKLILHRGSGRRQVTRNHKFVVFVFLIMRSLVSVCLAKIKIPCKNIRLIESRHRVAGIIVYSVKENRSWKIRNAKTMMADPSATQFAVNGITISAPINIAGIALGPEIRTSNDRVVVNEDREVYFCPLSSQHLYSVNTTVLRDENRARGVADYDNSIKDIGLKPSQTVGMVMDNQGILYYGLLGNSAVGRWDSRTPFSSGQRLIARDLKYLEWPNSFTFDPTGNLTVLTNSLAKFIFGKMNLDEYNFRLITSYVGGKELLVRRQLQLRLARRTLVRAGTHQPGAASSATPGASAAARTHTRRTPRS